MSGKTMQVTLPRGGFLDGNLVTGAKAGETVKVEPGKPVRVAKDYGEHLIHDRIADPITGKAKADTGASQKTADDAAAKKGADDAAAKAAAAKKAADEKAAAANKAAGGTASENGSEQAAGDQAGSGGM